MAYNTEEKSIQDFISENYVFCIPRNQRKFVWGEDELKNFIEDIYVSKDDYHFFGSIVLLKQNNNNYLIIDGQQRITAIELTICALLYKNLQEYLLNEKSEIKNNIDYLKELLYTNTKIGRLPKLKLEDKECGLLTSFLYIEKDEYNDIKRIIEEIDYLCSNSNKNTYIKIFNIICKLLDDNCQNYNTLMNFQDYMFGSHIIKITALNDYEAYTIFEVLNARGIPLKQIELCKNFIFKYYKESKTTDKCKIEWEKMYKNIEGIEDEFLNHFVRMYYGERIQKDDTYKVLRKKENLKTVKEFFRQLQKNAENYNKIVACDGTDKEISCYNYFRIKGNRQIRPLLLSLKSKKDEGILRSKIYDDILNTITKFFIGFNMIGITSNNIDHYVITSSNEIFKGKSESKIIESFISLIEKIKQFYPTKKDLEMKFKDIRYSNKNMKSNIKSELLVYFLKHIYIKSYIDTKKYNLDHIISDSSDNEIVYQLGNLMPIDKDFHASIKSENTASKLCRYGESGYKYLIDFSKKYKNGFGLEDINNQTEKIVKKLIDYYYIDLDKISF